MNTPGFGNNERDWTDVRVGFLIWFEAWRFVVSAENTKLVWWADRGRFVMHDVRSSDTTKTPMSTIRLTVICMTASIVNGVELVWTGHSGGELCVWNERGQLIAKPCKVFKSPIRYDPFL